MRKFFLLISMMCALHIAHATDYYAAPGVSSGSGSGTSSDPWELFDALSNIPADQGHTLILKNGTYTVTESVNIPTGVNMRGETNDSTQVVIYAEGASPIIRMNSAAGLFDPAANGNQTISYFTVESNYTSDVGVIVVARNNVKIKSLQVKKMEKNGIIITGWYANPAYDPAVDPHEPTRVTGSEIAYCYVYNCGRDQNGNGNYSHNMGFGGWSGGSIHHNVIEDYDRGDGENLGGYGLKSHNGGNTRNVHVYNNYIRVSEDVRRWGCKFTMEFDDPYIGMEYYNNTLVDGGVSWTEDEVDEEWKPTLEPGQYRLRFYNNEFIGYKSGGVGGQAIENYIDGSIHFNNYCEGFNAFIKTSPKGGIHNAVGIHAPLYYVQNVFYGNSSTGEFWVGGGDWETPHYNHHFYNNIIYNTENAFVMPRDKVYDCVFRNNVIVDVTEYVWNIKDGDGSENCVFDHNLVHNIGIDVIYPGSVISPTNTYTHDPELQKTGDKPYPYYAPHSSSYVVDKGVVIPGFTDGYTGSAPDLGAYEYGIGAVISVDGVDIPQTSIEVHQTKTKEVVAVVSPSNASDQRVTWQIADEAIATVDDYGIVTGVSTGTTTLTVTTVDGGFTDDVTINVVFIPVTGVSIDQSGPIEVVEGNWTNLTATVSPSNATNQALTWESSNTAVATVTELQGNVNGVSAGSTTITVTTDDGGFSDNIDVNVLSAATNPSTWWRMEENFDDSNGNVNGTSKSNNGLKATFDSGDKQEGSFSAVFEKDNGNWVDIDNSAFEDAINELSITAWIKAESTADTMILFEEGGRAAGLAIRIANNKLEVRARANDAENIDVSTGFTSTSWKHIAVRYSGSTIDLFIDGALAASNTNTNLASVNSHGNPAGLCARNDDDVYGEQNSGHNYDGKIDDVRIFNAAITDALIDAIYTDSPISEIPVTSVTLSNSNVTLGQDGSYYLDAFVEPVSADDKTVTWQSSNESVITVDGGKVFVANGVTSGTATVTVTTNDGGFTDQCDFTISGYVIDNRPEGVGLNQNEYVGNWTNSYPSSYEFHDTSLAWSNTIDDYVNIRFQGTKVEVHTTLDQNHGIAAISVDGGSETMVDLYGDPVIHATKVWESGTLSDSEHTLKIRVTGDKNTNSSSNYVVLDFVRVEGTAAPVTYYDLTTSATNGTITLDPSGGTYAEGSTVSATATPDAGYQFDGWSGAATGTTNPVDITMGANKSLTANFSVSTVTTYTLTTSATNGSIALSPGGGTYDDGTVVTATATPDAGYQFDGWSGAATGTTNPVDITMDANKSLTANFSEIPTGNDLPWVEDFSGLTNGTTSESGTDSDWSTSVGTPNGTFSVQSGQFDANELDVWMTWTSESIDISGTSAKISLDVSHAGSIDGWDDFEVYYALDGGSEVLIEHIDGATGLPKTITKDGLSGSSVEVIVKVYNTGSDEHYYFDNVKVEESGTPTTYYTLTTSAETGGDVSPLGSNDYAENTTVDITYTEDSGYEFSGWTGDVPSGHENDEILTITMDADRSITANFTEIPTGNDIPWAERFTGLSDGTTSESGTDSDWSLSGTANGYFEVSNEMLVANATGSEVVFTSQEIDITNDVVDISIDVYSTGDQETNDYVKFYYKVDGGSEIFVDEVTNDQPSVVTLSETGITGSTLQVIIKVYNTGSDEHWHIDNIEVYDPAIGIKSGKITFVESNTLARSVNLYPNPTTNGLVNLVLNGYETADKVLITVTDVSGRTVLSNTIQTDNSSSYESTLNLSNLHKGVYMLSVKTKGDLKVERLLVK